MRQYRFAWAYSAWQEGAIFNTNDPDEWQYQLDKSGNQWALDVGLSEAIAQFYGGTPITLTTTIDVSSSTTTTSGSTVNEGAVFHKIGLLYQGTCSPVRILYFERVSY
jgi:hypothetical protein